MRKRYDAPRELFNGREPYDRSVRGGMKVRAYDVLGRAVEERTTYRLATGAQAHRHA